MESILILGFGVYLVSTLVSMATMSLGAGFLLLTIFWAYRGPKSLLSDIRQSLQERHLRVYAWVSLALAVVCVLSVLLAWVYPLGFGVRFCRIEPWRLLKLWYLFWPLVLVPVLAKVSEAGRYRLLRTWLIAFFGLSVIAIFQYFTGWPRAQGIPSFVDRYHATVFLGHHLSVASIYIFPFFAALDFLRDRAKVPALGLSRSFLAAGSAVGAMALFLTFSRALWVALPVGLLLWFAWYLPRRWRAISIAVGGFGVMAASQLPMIYTRFHDGLALFQRKDIWAANWEFFKARPILGAGWLLNEQLSGIYFEFLRPGADHFQGHAHNNFLQMLAGTGVLGAFVWLAWCVIFVWVLWPSARRAQFFARGLVCAWLVFQINGLTQVNFWEGKVSHQMVAMLSWALLWARESK